MARCYLLISGHIPHYFSIGLFRYPLGCALPSNSHHQDFATITGIPIKSINLHLPLLLGGDIPSYPEYERKEGICVPNCEQAIKFLMAVGFTLPKDF